MKKIAFLFLLFALAAVAPANAQFKYGIRVGANLSNLKFDNGIKSSNIAGFTGGVMAEYTLPVLGIGVDGAVMYARRGAKLNFSASTLLEEAVGKSKSSTKLDYIEIPVNLKYKFSLPLSVLKPYVYAGPSFSFLVGDNIKKAFKEKKYDTSINAGLGVEVIGKVQVSAQYGWGLGKTISVPETDFNGKNRYWTISAAYLF